MIIGKTATLTYRDSWPRRGIVLRWPGKAKKVHPRELDIERGLFLDDETGRVIIFDTMEQITD